MGWGGGREVGNIRMLVDKGRGVVDFVVDYEVEILERQDGPTSAIERGFPRIPLSMSDEPSSSCAPKRRSM